MEIFEKLVSVFFWGSVFSVLFHFLICLPNKERPWGEEDDN